MGTVIEENVQAYRAAEALRRQMLDALEGKNIVTDDEFDRIYGRYYDSVYAYKQSLLEHAMDAHQIEEFDRPRALATSEGLLVLVDPFDHCDDCPIFVVESADVISEESLPSVRTWREPRSAEELAKAVFLFLDDSLGLIGGSGRNRSGGDICVDNDHFSARVIVSDTNRTDGYEWMKLSAEEVQIIEDERYLKAAVKGGGIVYPPPAASSVVFDQTLGFQAKSGGPQKCDQFGVRVRILPEAMLPELRKDGRDVAYMSMEDGRLIAVSVVLGHVDVETSLEKLPDSLAAYGREEAEDPEWVDDASELRNALVGFLEKQAKTQFLDLRVGGNGTGMLAVTYGNADLLMGIGRDPSS